MLHQLILKCVVLKTNKTKISSVNGPVQSILYFIALQAMVANSAVQSSTPALIHNAIFVDRNLNKA